MFSFLAVFIGGVTVGMAFAAILLARVSGIVEDPLDVSSDEPDFDYDRRYLENEAFEQQREREELGYRSEAS
jgi:hypothetical protein